VDAAPVVGGKDVAGTIWSRASPGWRAKQETSRTVFAWGKMAEDARQIGKVAGDEPAIADTVDATTGRIPSRHAEAVACLVDFQKSLAGLHKADKYALSLHATLRVLQVRCHNQPP
jgi:hypothetical protein